MVRGIERNAEWLNKKSNECEGHPGNQKRPRKPETGSGSAFNRVKA